LSRLKGTLTQQKIKPRKIQPWYDSAVWSARVLECLIKAHYIFSFVVLSTSTRRRLQDAWRDAASNENAI